MSEQHRAELARAHATLQRGAWFLGQGLGPAQGGPRVIAGRYRAKVVGNGLRELDRFLQLLIDALARASEIALPVTERNTANKLSRLRLALGAPDPDHARLRALGRSRDCLFHCGGLVRRGDPGATVMTTGWFDGSGVRLRRVAVGERINPSAADLLEICDYYRALGLRLFSEAGQPVPLSTPGTSASPGSARATGARSASSGR